MGSGVEGGPSYADTAPVSPDSGVRTPELPEGDEITPEIEPDRDDIGTPTEPHISRLSEARGATEEDKLARIVERLPDRVRRAFDDMDRQGLDEFMQPSPEDDADGLEAYIWIKVAEVGTQNARLIWKIKLTEPYVPGNFQAANYEKRGDDYGYISEDIEGDRVWKSLAESLMGDDLEAYNKMKADGGSTYRIRMAEHDSEEGEAYLVIDVESGEPPELIHEGVKKEPEEAEDSGDDAYDTDDGAGDFEFGGDYAAVQVPLVAPPAPANVLETPLIIAPATMVEPLLSVREMGAGDPETPKVEPEELARGSVNTAPERPPVTLDSLIKKSAEPAVTTPTLASEAMDRALLASVRIDDDRESANSGVQSVQPSFAVAESSIMMTVPARSTLSTESIASQIITERIIGAASTPATEKSAAGSIANAEKKPAGIEPIIRPVELAAAPELVGAATEAPAEKADATTVTLPAPAPKPVSPAGGGGGQLERPAPAPTTKVETPGKPVVTARAETASPAIVSAPALSERTVAPTEVTAPQQTLEQLVAVSSESSTVKIVAKPEVQTVVAPALKERPMSAPEIAASAPTKLESAAPAKLEDAVPAKLESASFQTEAAAPISQLVEAPRINVTPEVTNAAPIKFESNAQKTEISPSVKQETIAPQIETSDSVQLVEAPAAKLSAEAPVATLSAEAPAAMPVQTQSAKPLAAKVEAPAASIQLEPAAKTVEATPDRQAKPDRQIESVPVAPEATVQPQPQVETNTPTVDMPALSQPEQTITEIVSSAPQVEITPINIHPEVEVQMVEPIIAASAEAPAIIIEQQATRPVSESAIIAPPGLTESSRVAESSIIEPTDSQTEAQARAIDAPVFENSVGNATEDSVPVANEVPAIVIPEHIAIEVPVAAEPIPRQLSEDVPRVVVDRVQVVTEIPIVDAPVMTKQAPIQMSAEWPVTADPAPVASRAREAFVCPNPAVQEISIPIPPQPEAISVAIPAIGVPIIEMSAEPITETKPADEIAVHSRHAQAPVVRSVTATPQTLEPNQPIEITSAARPAIRRTFEASNFSRPSRYAPAIAANPVAPATSFGDDLDISIEVDEGTRTRPRRAKRHEVTRV